MSRAATLLRHAGACAVLLAATLALAPAQAGQPCEARPLTVDAVSRGMALAQATAQRLEASGAEVVVLARAGQDLRRYGLQWSHLGLAYRDAAATDADGRPRPQWRVLHKLNHCGSGEAQLYRQGLGEFFLDQPHRYEAAFVVLAPAVQARLAPLLADNARGAQWHLARYSMVAYAWGTRYQQSNQWAIETLGGAMASGAIEGSEGQPPALPSDIQARRERAQAWLRLSGYVPTPLSIGPLERLGARLTAAHIAFDDHPDAQRYAGRIDTVTVDSVLAWLARSGLGRRAQRVHCTACQGRVLPPWVPEPALPDRAPPDTQATPQWPLAQPS